MSLTPEPFTAIYELTREWSTYAWLCEFHLETVRTDGWTAKYRAHTTQPCDRCPRAPSEYLRPDGSVRYVPTARAARLPTKAECPPPKPLKPWRKPKAAPGRRAA